MRKKATTKEISAVAILGGQGASIVEIAKQTGLGYVAVKRIYNHLQRVGHMGDVSITVDLPPIAQLQKGCSPNPLHLKSLCLKAFNSAASILSSTEVHNLINSVGGNFGYLSIANTMIGLKNKGLAERVARGYYRLTPAGLKAKNNLPGEADVCGEPGGE